MLGTPLVTKNYAGTAVNATQRFGAQDLAVYKLDSSTGTDETSLEIRYQRSAPKRVKYSNLVESLSVDMQVVTHKLLVKGVRRVLTTYRGWQTTTVNLTLTYEDDKQTVTDVLIKDLVANVCHIPLTAATMTKLFNEES